MVNKCNPRGTVECKSMDVIKKIKWKRYAYPF